MAFVPALNTVRVFFEHAIHGNSGHGWVFHYKLAGLTPGIEEMEFLAAELVDWWNVNVRAFMGSYVSLQRLRLLDLTTAESFEFTWSAGLPITGTRVGTDLPANLAFCIKLSTGLSGRSNRGRTYFFGMVEGDVTGNSVTTTYANGVRSAMNAALEFDDGLGAIWNLVVASFISGGQPRVTAQINQVINASYVDLRVDTQRRRLPRGGS